MNDLDFKNLVFSIGVIDHTQIDPRQTQTKSETGKFISAKIDSQKHIPKNPLTTPYLCYAYGVPKRTFKNWRKEKKEGKKPNEKVNSASMTVAGNCVIKDKEFARIIYNPKWFYIQDKYCQWRTEEVASRSKSEVEAQKMKFSLQWDEDVKGNDLAMMVYEKAARDHDRRQPYIATEIANALNRGVRSYSQLVRSIDGWCGKKTIMKWLTKHDTFCMYYKHILPGLTKANSNKQIEFSMHVHDNWGLPRGQPYLWVHSDEKWFFGLVSR